MIPTRAVVSVIPEEVASEALVGSASRAVALESCVNTQPLDITDWLGTTFLAVSI